MTTMIECKSALNRVKGMPFSWSLNPYRGCSHACIYCYARANHTYMGLNAGDDFVSKLFVKQNFVETLRRELSRPGWHREEVAIGTATDPYQPIEGRHRLTAGVITALADYATPGHIVTKSPLVIRDIDELCRLEERAGATVCMTITTMDPVIWRKVEPGTPPPHQRIRALRMLAEAGVPCGIFLAPVLPRITDSEASLRAVMQAAKEAGARFVWSSPLRLDTAIRDVYMDAIAQEFPELLERYQRNYHRADAPTVYRDHLRERFNRIRDEIGLSGEGARPEPRSIAPRQLAFAV